MIFLERMRDGHRHIRQTLELFQRWHWGNFWEMGWSAYVVVFEHTDTILNWTELNCTHFCPSGSCRRPASLRYCSRDISSARRRSMCSSRITSGISSEKANHCHCTSLFSFFRSSLWQHWGRRLVFLVTETNLITPKSQVMLLKVKVT